MQNNELNRMEPEKINRSLDSNLITIKHELIRDKNN